MAIDVETLLAPVSEDAPAGEDLSYDPERYELEQLFEVADAPVEEGSEPPEVDWRRGLQLIERQFARSKDVWLAVYLARAGARSGAVETVEAGAEALAGLFERYWDTMHPTLDDLGLPGRKAPCDSLTSFAGFLRPMERVVLFAHPRLGSYSGADLERFRSGGANEEGYGLFRAALEELPPETLNEAHARLERIEAALRRADAVFTGAAGSEATNFAPAYEVMARLRKAIAPFMTGEAAEAAQAQAASNDSPGGGGGSAPRRSGGGGFSGGIESREDVVRALDAAMDYFLRNEPASPVPLALARAKAWISMDFLSIMQDLAPDGVDQAQGVLKLRPAPETYG